MRLTATFFVAALLLAPCMAQADIPQFMSYQGVLRDAAGNPVPDGTYSVEFNLYDVETGGTTLWTEPHTLTATGGIIEAKLGSITPLSGLSFEVPYWLGISVESETELVPRTEFATVPYAGRAGSAETCDEIDDHDWEAIGDDIYRGVGNVGVGILPPVTKFHVVTGSEPCARFEGGGGTTNFTIRGMNSAGTCGAFFSGTGASSSPITPSAVYGVGGAGSQGAQFYSEGSNGLLSVSPNGRAVWGKSTGNYAGYFEGGGWGVYVDDQLETNAFRMQPGAAYGYVLTSNSGGDGTWQPAAALADGDWTVAASDIYSAVPGRVGIGLTLPTAKLEIYNETSEEALEVKQGAVNTGRMVNFERTFMPGVASDVLQLKVPTDSPIGIQFIECERGGTVEFAIDGDGYIDSNSGANFAGTVYATAVDVTGQLYVSGNSVSQAEFSSSSTGLGARIVNALATGSGTVDVTALYGESVPAEGYGIGGWGKGGYVGLYGEVVPTGSAYYRGVYGTVSGGGGTNYGVRGYAANGTYNYAVYGYATGGTAYAGYFSGNAHVTNTFTAGVKSFKIDHPLDPENKYLQHSCVESDEMTNMYNGNVVLDARGEATVEMPDWFEVLNQNFRYQLTAIGAPGPNLYIAEEISGGRFTIAGGEAGMKVSWMVTGVRHDPLAVASRVVVEVDKPANEVGKYMHPEAYGMPVTAGVDYHEDRETPTAATAGERVSQPVRDRSDGD